MLTAFAILTDGLVYAAYLFLVAVGLTLIFGVMKILNVTHGSFYAFGAYGAATAAGIWYDRGLPDAGGFLFMVAFAMLIGIVIGIILERGILRFAYGKEKLAELEANYKPDEEHGGPQQEGPGEGRRQAPRREEGLSLRASNGPERTLEARGPAPAGPLAASGHHRRCRHDERPGTRGPIELRTTCRWGPGLGGCPSPSSGR